MIEVVVPRIRDKMLNFSTLMCLTFFSEGIRVFFRGYVPNLLGILPYAGIDLTVYETLKRKYLSQYNAEGAQPPGISLLCFGTFSSCCGQLAAYPLALVRTKLQSQGNIYLD